MSNVERSGFDFRSSRSHSVPEVFFGNTSHSQPTPEVFLHNADGSTRLPHRAKVGRSASAVFDTAGLLGNIFTMPASIWPNELQLPTAPHGSGNSVSYDGRFHQCPASVVNELEAVLLGQELVSEANLLPQSIQLPQPISQPHILPTLMALPTHVPIPPPAPAFYGNPEVQSSTLDISSLTPLCKSGFKDENSYFHEPVSLPTVIRGSHIEDHIPNVADDIDFTHPLTVYGREDGDMTRLKKRDKNREAQRAYRARQKDRKEMLKSRTSELDYVRRELQRMIQEKQEAEERYSMMIREKQGVEERYSMMIREKQEVEDKYNLLINLQLLE